MTTRENYSWAAEADEARLKRKAEAARQGVAGVPAANRKRPLTTRNERIVIGVFVLLTVLVPSIVGYYSLRSSPGVLRRMPVAPVSDEVQSARRKIIAGLERGGVIQKIDRPGRIPRVHVLPGFRSLTFDQKQTFLSVVAGYEYKVPQGGTLADMQRVRVMDAMTGKVIGRYTNLGLEMD